MNVDGLISRATHTSGRSLIATSSIVLLSEWYEFPLNKFPIIAQSDNIPEQMVVTAAAVLLIFLIIVHILNWINDYIGYKASFSLFIIKDMIEPNNITDEGDGRSPERIWKENRKTIEASNTAQKLSLYIQHLAVPLIAGLLAIALIAF